MTPDQGRRVLLISVSSVRRGADAGLASNGPSRLGMLDLTGAGTRGLGASGLDTRTPNPNPGTPGNQIDEPVTCRFAARPKGFEPLTF